MNGRVNESGWSLPDSGLKSGAVEDGGEDDSHLTEAGLLSIPVTSAKVESAIISLLALESHSSISSRSEICFTSTTPMT